MSRPERARALVPAPGEIDEDLGEFWVGDPWAIFEQHNLSCFERNRLFLNAGAGVFVEASHVSGADHDGDGRAALPVDFDHDGRQDLIVRQVGGAPLIAYANRMGGGSFLNVSLRGVESNRLGVGARLIAHVGGLRLTRERFPENTFRSQEPLVVHFGLGEADRVDRLEIRWPSGRVQVLTDLEAGRHVVVTEGSDELIVAAPGTIVPPTTE